MAPTPVTTTTTIAESAMITSGGMPVEGNGVSKQSSKALGRSQSPGRAGRRIGPPGIVLSVREQARSDATSTTFTHGAESARAGSEATAKTTTEDTEDTSAGSSNDQTTVRKTSSQTKAKGKEVPGRIVQASGQGSSSQMTTGRQTSSSTTSTGQMGRGLSQSNPWGPSGGSPSANPWGPPAGGPLGVPPGGGGGGGGSGPPPPGPAAPIGPAAAIGQPGVALIDDEALKGHPPEVFDGDRAKAKK